jgi:hypothetical protein
MMSAFRFAALALCLAAGGAAAQPPADAEEATTPWEDLTTPAVLYRNGWAYADAGYRCIARYEQRGAPTVTIITELGEFRAKISVEAARLPRIPEAQPGAHPELVDHPDTVEPPQQRAVLRPGLSGRRFPGTALLVDGQIATTSLHADEDNRSRWEFGAIRSQLVDLLGRGRALQIYGAGRLRYTVPIAGSAQMAQRLRRCFRDGSGYEG